MIECNCDQTEIGNGATIFYACVQLFDKPRDTANHFLYSFHPQLTFIPGNKRRLLIGFCMHFPSHFSIVKSNA